MDLARRRESFLALWRRALQLPTLTDLNPADVREWAERKGLIVREVLERDVGHFRPTPAIVLKVDGDAACLPKVPAAGDANWQIRRTSADENAALWEKVEWFSPLWVPNAKAQELLAAVRYRTREDAVAQFHYHMSTQYTLAFQARCIAQFLPAAPSLAEFVALAREAYLAFYSGYRASSIAALIPVVEGALRRMVTDPPDLTVPDQVDRAIDKAIAIAATLHFDGMWVPSEYTTINYLFGQDERAFVFETLRRWLKKSFFRPTGEYDGVTWLNRHLFAHAASADWQQSANFARLVVALATLGFVETWNDGSNGVPLLAPEMNGDSTLLWQQAQLRAQIQMALNLQEQQVFQTHGRLVPEMPTDDGVTLRKALLSEDCIKDLVRPLRATGWSIEVGEPDKQALYLTVVATSATSRLKAALLFSCATDNALYRELAQTCDVILYRGAPYLQDQYAHGINVHVGPVTGWQPPIASAARSPVSSDKPEE
jgi:hypothetical protein